MVAVLSRSKCFISSNFGNAPLVWGGDPGGLRVDVMDAVSKMASASLVAMDVRWDDSEAVDVRMEVIDVRMEVVDVRNESDPSEGIGARSECDGLRPSVGNGGLFNRIGSKLGGGGIIGTSPCG